MNNDTLEDLFNANGDTMVRRSPPSTYEPIESRIVRGTHEEQCGKCRGTGQFIGYSGRVLGECFACKGAGKKVYKNNAETRQRTREQAATRKFNRQVDNAATFTQSHPAEAAWLVATAPRWELAASLLEAVKKYGDLTEKQMAVVRQGIGRDAVRAEASRQAAADRVAAPTVDVSKVVEAFARARRNAANDGEGVKWLKLHLDTFVFSDAPANGQWPAAVFVKEGSTKLGRIVNGKFLRSFACDDATQARIVAAAQDPEAAALAYGLRTSSCSCCGRELTNEVSRRLGIGPICRERFFGI